MITTRLVEDDRDIDTYLQVRNRVHPDRPGRVGADRHEQRRKHDRKTGQGRNRHQAAGNACENQQQQPVAADPIALQQQTQYRRQIAAIMILLILACSVGLALGLRESPAEDDVETSRPE